MATRRDLLDPPSHSHPDALRVFSAYLSQATRPGTRLQPFLDGLLCACQAQWPGIIQAAIYLRATDGTYRRAACIGAPGDASETPPPASAAARALAGNALVTPGEDSDPASWAAPLTGGDGVAGVLHIDLPAHSPAARELNAVLPALALSLGLAVELVQTVPLTRALALSRKLPRDCTPADVIGAFVSYLADDAHLPLSLTLYDYEHDRPVRAQTFHRAHPGDGITGEPPLPVAEHPLYAAVPDLARGQPVIIPELYATPLIAAAAHEGFRARHITALTLIPLATNDRLAGVLAVGGLLPDPHSLPGLQTLAGHIAVLVQNKALFERASHALDEAKQRAAFEEALSEITSHLQQPTDLRDLLQQTMHVLGHALGARRARVRLKPQPGPDGAQTPQREE